MIPTLLRLAGVAHLGLIAAGALMPRVVGLPEHLAGLPPFIRRLVWLYYTFIGTCLVGFGAGSFFLAQELASGTVLARAACGFLSFFWTLRLAAALFVLDVRPYLTRPILRLGFLGTDLVFALLPIAYAIAAIGGGVPC